MIRHKGDDMPLPAHIVVDVILIDGTRRTSYADRFNWAIDSERFDERVKWWKRCTDSDSIARVQNVSSKLGFRLVPRRK